MIFDPEIYCTAAETAELDGTAPLALAGDGLWVGVLSRGACLLDGVDRPGQSGASIKNYSEVMTHGQH